MFDIPPILHETLAGRYVLKREIGRGGAATVYLAHDVKHERLVAVKLLHRELSHALGAQRFMREIKLTASLQHPHILSIHDSGEVNDQLFYVMPYVENESLRQRLQGDSRLSIEEAVRIGREIAGALAYAHERGVVHRDIKPENILFSGGHAILADFGIARAINRAHEKITAQGMITGTPAYMSPEQARDRGFDGRSDVYSLACVLYEAIAGVPPFVGDTPQQLLTQRFTRTAPLLREYRHDVSPQIESVIAKALAISPDDRFDDARAFSAALSAALGNSGETVTQRVARRPLIGSPWLWAAGVAVLTTVGAASTERGRDQIDIITGRVDTTQIAVVPFQYIGARSPAAEQEPVSQGLYVAMREWNGLKLSSDVSIDDDVQRSNVHTLDKVLSTARHSRAGRAVWGRVRLTADSIHIRAVVYDAISGRSVRERPLSGPRNLLTAHPEVLRRLAADLLRAEDAPRTALGGDIGTRSFAAWQAYQEGQRELANWRVATAMSAFERASALDADYAHPRAWLAQLMMWRGDPSSQWVTPLAAAVRNRASLGERDALIVDAMLAIQVNRFDDACKSYRSLIALDSLDATGWLGLTYCQAVDRLVVKSASSTSGWTFRGSSWGAQRAYTRAVSIAPASFAIFPFAAISRFFVTEGVILRTGATADSVRYFALPSLSGDTIASNAQPMTRLFLDMWTHAPLIDVALQRNRDALLAIMSAVTQRLPGNALAFEELARVLESRDDITGTPNGGYSALSALERAISLSTDSVQRVRLGAFDVRLHLKLGDFARTKAIGDSLLRARPEATLETAAHLAGVAALLGHEQLAVKYTRASGERISESTAPSVALLEDVGTALFVRAALGACDDSLFKLRARVETLLESYTAATQREQTRIGLLRRPLQLGAECFGPRAMADLDTAHSQGIFRRLQLFARGDIAGARRSLDSTMLKRRTNRPGGVSLDLTVTDAWLLAASGDTAAAIKRLDLTLTALPTLSYSMAREVGMSAAVGRAMALRATLAARQHDAGTAALWAGRVLTLWADADSSLQPSIARMRALVKQRG